MSGSPGGYKTPSYALKLTSFASSHSLSTVEGVLKHYNITSRLGLQNGEETNAQQQMQLFVVW